MYIYTFSDFPVGGGGGGQPPTLAPPCERP